MSTSAKRAGTPDKDASHTSLDHTLRGFAATFDTHFEKLLTPARPVPQRILDAVRYATLAPGKRLRPFLVVRCCELVSGKTDEAWPIAAAIECVHAFSLIHDDLPAMDDDDLRRGRPTCHVRFDEATAILTGDALVAFAFELLTQAEDTAIGVQLVRELAEGTGWSGMIGGQMDDILGQTQPPNLELTISIHQRKTARLFATACRMGALIGRGSAAQADALGSYGQTMGRAFQIADDLLDLTTTAEAMGKATGKDASANKQTFPRVVGIEESRAASRELVESATAALSGFGTEADDLRALAGYAVDRNY